MVLDDLNLQIPAGKVTALCGLSGAGTELLILYNIIIVIVLLGKSTVAALLERFYDIEFGEIHIDGRSVRQRGRKREREAGREREREAGREREREREDERQQVYYTVGNRHIDNSTRFIYHL